MERWQGNHAIAWSASNCGRRSRPAGSHPRPEGVPPLLMSRGSFGRWLATMVLRWTAAGVRDAERGFRKVAGYRGLAKLIEALHAHDAILDRSVKRVDAAKAPA